MRTKFPALGVAALMLLFASCKKSQMPSSQFFSAAELEQQAVTMENMDFDSAFVLHLRALQLFEKMPPEERGDTYFSNIISVTKGLDIKDKQARGWLDSLTQQNVVALGEDYPELAKLYLEQGRFLLQARNPDSALVIFNKAEKLLRHRETSDEISATWHCQIGEYYLAKEDTARANSSFLEVIRNENFLPSANVAQALAGLYRITLEKDADSAIVFLKKAISIHQKPGGSRVALIDLFFSLSATYFRVKSDYVRMLEFADSTWSNAVVIFKTPCVMLDDAASLLANACMVTGDYERAHKMLDASMLYCKKMDRPDLIANRTFTKATIFKNQGKLDDAIRLYNQVIPALDSFNNTKNLISAHNNLGNALMVKKDYPESERITRKALELKKINNSADRDIATSYFNLAQLRNAQSDYLEAEIYLDSTRVIFDSLKIMQGVVRSNLHNHYGWSFLGQKKYDEALRHFRLSVKALSPSFDLDKPDALPNLSDALFDKIQMLYPLGGMGRVLFLQKKHDLASAVYARAIELTDMTRSGFVAEGSKQNLMEMARLVFEGAMENAAATGDCKEAFRLAEKSKAVVLGEGIKNKEIQFKNIPEKLLDEEARLKSVIAEKEKTLNGERQNTSADNRQKINELEVEIVALKNNLETFLASLKQGYPEYFNLKYDLSVASVQTAQTFLQQPQQAETAIIEYFLGDSTMVVFGIDASTSICSLQIVDKQFRDDLNTLRRITSDSMPGTHGSEKWVKDFDTFTAVSRRLYSTLLEPVLPKLKATRLVIIPDGELGYLPFHALLANDPDAAALSSYDYGSLPYLFENRVIRYENSATLMLSNLPKKRWFGGGYAGFAPVYLTHKKEQPIAAAVIDLQDNPRVRGNLEPLKYNLSEVEKCQAAWGGQGYFGAGATERNFMKAAGDATVLHLSMHALTDDVEPAWSQLVFSVEPGKEFDNHLHAFELYNMRLGADLAVLSACNTGNGRLAKGEGVQSLARAFRYAGCPSVVMTLWAANDLSTQEITVSFFEKLQKGERKDDALNAAVGSYLHNTSIKSKSPKHPFFWAHYMLVGNEAPVPAGFPRWILWAGGLVLLVSLAGWFWMKRNR